MNSLSFPVVHPSFQNLKRSGKLLHLTAAVLILIHGVTHIIQPGGSFIYSGCLFLIAIDIFILLFVARNVLEDQPMVNLFFRFVEFIFFLGIGSDLLMRGNWTTGSMHLMISVAYVYLFYCEKKMDKTEFVAIHHTGVTIPGLPDSKFFIWSNISRIEAHYDHIIIDTSLQKSYHFHLKKNLQFEELDQIHEFCRHYLQQR